MNQTSHYYLSGPMTGIDDYNFPAFHEAARRLRKQGFSVFNPAESFDGKQDLEWTVYMKHDYESILSCGAIMLLEGWQNSLGAVLEVLFALSIGKPVFELTGYGSARLYQGTNDARAMVEDVLLNFKPSKTLAVGEAVIVNQKDETILEEAQRLVHGDRGNAYGHPIDDFTKSALIMTAVLYDKLKPGEQVVAEDVPLLMQGVKISRETNKPKRDNRTDGAGYWETLDMVRSERQRREALQAELDLENSKKRLRKLRKKERAEEMRRNDILKHAKETWETFNLENPKWSDYNENGVPYWEESSVYESTAQLDQIDRFPNLQ
jgi:hypothetical protein